MGTGRIEGEQGRDLNLISLSRLSGIHGSGHMTDVERHGGKMIQIMAKRLRKFSWKKIKRDCWRLSRWQFLTFSLETLIGIIMKFLSKNLKKKFCNGRK
jgi:hypothetical protein